MKIKSRYVTPWLVPFLCAACAVQPDEDANAPGEDDVATAEEPLVIAQVDLPSGQQIKFLGTGPDMVTVFETGPIGPAPVLENKRLSGVAELYRKLVDVPDPQVVATLERADQAAVRLEAESEGISPPIEEPTHQAAPESADGVGVNRAAVNYNFVAGSPWATVAQLNSAECLLWAFDTGFCLYNYWNADTGYTAPTSHVRSLVVHAWNVGTVTHQQRQYVCISELFGACLDRAWRTTSTQTIQPGQYGLITSGYKWTRYISSTSNAALHHIGLWDYL
jgi:hypothetical protein